MCGCLPPRATDVMSACGFVRLRLLGAGEQARHVCSVPGGRTVRTSLWRIQGFVSQTDRI